MIYLYFVSETETNINTARFSSSKVFFTYVIEETVAQFSEIDHTGMNV